MAADSTDVTDANPFWNFSLAFYAEPGVADSCIALQDATGLDVNLLLYCCYASSCGLPLAPAGLAAVEAACADWRDDKVRPIRALRRQSDAELRGKLLEAELLAEQEQQRLMWQHRAPAGDWRAGPYSIELLGINLEVLAAVTGIARDRLASFEAIADRFLSRPVA